MKGFEANPTKVKPEPCFLDVDSDDKMCHLVPI